ncbi:MAG: hypothetical protein LWY06_16940 [Firmicutes bacterium]|nr:hypothetical protein [Bacillota bacterium]
MASKAEQIQEILNELGEQVSQTGDQQLISAFEKIYDRLDEARKCLEKGEDSTGKKLTSRAIGLFVLKTWRMTVQPDFNKFLVKKAPRQYRKLTMLFEKIHQFTVETLGYDYKQYKKCEDEFVKIYPFLQEAEKGFRLAGEREEDGEKAKFLTERADDLNFIIFAIFGGKDKKGSILAQPEIEEKVSIFWSKIANIEWDSYITNTLRNPTFVLNDTGKRYPEIMDSLLIKKFMPTREIPKEKEKAAAISLDTDAKHLEFEKGTHKPMKKKGTVATGPKIAATKKIGGKTGKVMPRRDSSKFRDSMYGQRPDRLENEGEETARDYMNDSGEIEDVGTGGYNSPEIMLPEEQLMPESAQDTASEGFSHNTSVDDDPPGEIISPPQATVSYNDSNNATDTDDEQLPELPPEIPDFEEPITPEPISVEPQFIAPQPAAPPPVEVPIAQEPEKKAGYNDESAVYSYSAKKQKEQEEHSSKETEASVKAKTETGVQPQQEEKKKGCLPFMIGISGAAILVCYYLFTLISGK